MRVVPALGDSTLSDSDWNDSAYVHPLQSIRNDQPLFLVGMIMGSRESRIDSRKETAFTPSCKARSSGYASFRFHVRIQTALTVKRAPKKRAEKHVHTSDLASTWGGTTGAHAIRLVAFNCQS